MHILDIAASVGGHRCRSVIIQQRVGTQVGDSADAHGLCFFAPRRREGVRPVQGGCPVGAGLPDGSSADVHGTIKLPLTVDVRKQLGMVGDALGGRQEQHAIGFKRVVKTRNQAVLQLGLHIDHQIAATEQIEPGERRVLDHVLHREHHHVAQFLFDLIAGPSLDKETGQAFGRDVLGDVRRIDARPRRDNRVLIQIGGIDLNIQFLLVFGPECGLQLGEQDGDRVGFLAGRATGYPDAEVIAGFFARHQPGQDDFSQHFVRPRVAEEAGDVDQQLLDQQLRFSGVLAQIPRIRRFGFDFVLRHAAMDAPADGAFFVEREVLTRDAAQLQQNLIDPADDFFRHERRHAQPVRSLLNRLQQHRRHLFHRQDVRGAAGLNDTLRHAVILGRRRLLHHADAAGGENRAQTLRAIGGGTRENNADRARRLIIGQRAHKHVDRHSLSARLLRNCHLQHAVEQRHIAVGGDDINMIGRDREPVDCFEHRHAGAPLQNFGQQADMAGIEMRHQDECHVGIRRAGTEERLKGFQPAGRSADANDGTGGCSGRCRHRIEDGRETGGLCGAGKDFAQGPFRSLASCH